MKLPQEQIRLDLARDEAIWTPARQALWQRIEQHDFEPDTPLNFTRRLARDHGWSLQQTRAAIGAYRRFCFLAMISPAPVTPSEIVDEVWHLHLLYSQDYWALWCDQRLQKPLHHSPTTGGPDARAIHRRQYAETLALHERAFGPPSPALWPAAHLLFGRPIYQMMDRQRYLAVPRPGAWLRRALQKVLGRFS